MSNLTLNRASSYYGCCDECSGTNTSLKHFIAARLKVSCYFISRPRICILLQFAFSSFFCLSSNPNTEIIMSFRRVILGRKNNYTNIPVLSLTYLLQDSPEILAFNRWEADVGPLNLTMKTDLSRSSFNVTVWTNAVVTGLCLNVGNNGVCFEKGQGNKRFKIRHYGLLSYF